jgi:hypothetical protein
LIRRITLLNARRKLCESHGLSLSEWIVAEIRRPSKTKSTLSSARAEASLCQERSKSAFSITQLNSAINLCIAGIPVIPLLNPPQMSDDAEGDVRAPHLNGFDLGKSKTTRLTFGFKYSAQAVTVGSAQEEKGGSRILLRLDHHVSTQWR